VVDGAARVEARFAPVKRILPKPALALTNRVQFLDLAGDGRPDVVQFAGSTPGFYERTMDEQWKAFVPFVSLPNVDWTDPNLKFIDLDGDGHADILISEHEAFVWHRSVGEDGFETAGRAIKPWDEEKGPRIVFADAEQSIYLSDMSGDGLTDIVRIRSGEVCYWTNLGYGRFGAKVTMDNAPRFDDFGQFDHRRIRLADIDGTGTTDILYLHRDGVRVYFNQSGNSWSAATEITSFPALDNVVGVQALDLLGNGTACLVWSSPLPGDARRSLRYLDLIGGQKPHLLVKTINNFGGETTVDYAPSTKFYLQDRLAGKPWVTKLSYPIHCVERVTVSDKWRGTTFSTTYRYHHGYFDGTEREFRGFGCVEVIDVEDYGTFAAGNVNSPYITDDKTLYQPPVKTVTWYHTGAFLDREGILSHFRGEYFLNPVEHTLPEPDINALDLTDDEWREALRACKGMMLRQEVYELDVDALAAGAHKPVKLFSTAYHNCHVRRVQPKQTNRHAVFFVTESEAITYHYELDLRLADPPDPRISHMLNLSVDEYGNIQQSVVVVYPRVGRYIDATLLDGAQQLIQHLQSETHIAYTETRFTNDIVPVRVGGELQNADTYRLRLPCEVLTYELTGIAQADAPGIPYLTLDDLRGFRLSAVYQAEGANVAEIAYHELPTHGAPQKRLVDHIRSLYFRDDPDDADALKAPRPFRELGSLALPYETYKLALTGALLNAIFNDAAGNKLDQPVGASTVRAQLDDPAVSGYLSGTRLAERFADLNNSGQYWIRSGIVGFVPDAARHFYLPERYTDAFGNDTALTYDDRDLFIKSSEDALGNITHVVRFDYRLLAPIEVEDLNRNRTEVAFDVLGRVIAAAVKGKAQGQGWQGDDLTVFDLALCNPPEAAVQAFCTSAEFDAAQRAQARTWLGRASARFVYHFGEARGAAGNVTSWADQMASACVIQRETHASQPGGDRSPLQIALECSDGSGSVIMRKVQAEPAPGSATQRWAVNGLTVLNNKGKPVKQYEPTFSEHFGCEMPQANGVTSLMYYDALGRMVRTEMPDGSFSRVEFSPWHIRHYDVNDTVRGSAWFAARGSPDPTQPSPGTPDARAAWLAAQHADTPALTLLDTLGRQVVAVAHNRVRSGNAWVDERYVTFTRLDAEDKPLWVQDSRGNRVMQYIAPPLPEGARRFDDPHNLTPQGFAPCYDIAGNLLFQHSMEAGERWMLIDAAGKPMFAWNSRKFFTRVTYDKLLRPTGSFVTGADPANPAREIQYEKLVYGEGQPNDQQRNLRGKSVEHSDTAGVVTVDAYDFKGNPLNTTRQFTMDYKTTPDWSQDPALEAEKFAASKRYDALSRPIQIIAPHSTETNPPRFNVTQHGYNEAGLLERVDVWLAQPTAPETLLAGNTASQHVVTNVNYNAKGQRVLLEYGNGSETTYDYELDTFRLKRMKTTRRDNGVEVALQDLNYTYDPMGNITQVRDDAQDRVFHSNQCVLPGAEYHYDALYRLTAASGREHKGNDQQYDWDDMSHFVNTLPNNCLALQNYIELYRYDSVGNIMQVEHHSGRNLEQPGQVIWNRRYQYALGSNRLLATSLLADPAGLPDYVDVPGYSAKYSYDPHGSMTSMPHLTLMQSNFHDYLSVTSRQVVNETPPPSTVPEKTYYVYDAAGQRARKITETQTGARGKQRIYIGEFEVYREYGVGTVRLERESLHVMDDQQRVLLIETQTVKDQAPVANPQPVVRYQLDNHLGSVCLELDAGAAVITYEEYTPYGSSAYCAGRSTAEVSLKRYRYTGKERDQENGFTYHGARYCAPWLARWTACDPAGIKAGLNVFAYVRLNPIGAVDPNGTEDVKPSPPPPRVPEVGKDPDAVLAESKFNRAWEEALEWRYEKGSLRDNLKASREKIESAADPSEQGRTEYKALFDRVKRQIAKDPELSKYSWEESQLHHLRPVKVGDAADPGAATDPNNIVFARGDAKVEGTSHNKLHFGEENKRMEKYAADTKGSPTGRPAKPAQTAPPASTTAPPAPTGTPTPAASPPPKPATPTPAASPPPKTATPSPASVPHGMPPAPPAPGRLARAAAWTAETAPVVLRRAGQILTVYGAVNEGQRTADLIHANNQGAFNAATNGLAVTIITVGAGVVDDGVAALAIAASGSPAPVMDSWDTHGSGPVQHAVGEAYRGILKWAWRNGL
jgi:RHS repeat-associated protein